jgi:hypothetical protein
MKRAFCRPVTALVTCVGLLALLLVLISASVAFAQTPATTPTVQGTTVPPAQAVPSSITILGQVSNGTPGGSLPVTMSVTLYAADNAQSVAFTTNGTTDASGKVRFDKVAYQPGRAYALVTTLGTVQYQSNPAEPKANETLILPVKIYDTTTDSSHVRIDQMYVIAHFSSETQLQVVNAYLLENNGDRTVQGGQKTNDGKQATLRFPLPAGARSVSFQGDQGGNYVLSKDGFLTVGGIPPGLQRTPLVVSYALPYTMQLRLETRAPYPVQNVNVAVAQQGVTLTAPSLKDQGLQTDQNGTSYRVYTGTALAAGQALALELQGLPKIGAPEQSTSQPGAGAVTLVTPAAGGLEWDDKRLAGGALAGAGLLVVLVALLWYVIMGRRREADASGEHRVLYDAIADLDEEHEAGKIGDEDYAQQRQLLKEALLAAMEDESQAAELVPESLAR